MNMLEIAEYINQIWDDCANGRISDTSASCQCFCEECIWLEEETMDNPNYCNRIDDIDEAVAACKKRFCPHYITFDQVKKMQDEYKQLCDKVAWYERDEFLRNYGGKG